MAEQTRTSTRDFVVEVVEQLKKVTWPDRAQLLDSTKIIVIFMLVVAVVIFGLDRVVSLILNAFSSLFLG
jgi:preprotein translocase SecE subunit